MVLRLITSMASLVYVLKASIFYVADFFAFTQQKFCELWCEKSF